MTERPEANTADGARRSRWHDIEAIDLPRNVGALLRRACQLYPDRIACQFPLLPDRPNARLTYTELDQEVARMAAGLAAAGVARDSRVGAVLRNVPEFPLLWLALARLGATIVPVNPLYRAGELDHTATSSEMTHLVIDADNLPVLEQATETRGRIESQRIIVVGGDTSSTKGFTPLVELIASALDPQPPFDDPGPDDLLNIQFTSGTTGLPKGCMLTHRYWVTIGVVFAEFACKPQRLLADRPFFYMQNQTYLMMSLWTGGQIVVTPRMSRSRFFEWIDTYEIDFAWYVDVMHASAPKPEDRQSTLRFVGSDGIHGDLHRAAEERFNVTIRDCYASTEVGAGIAVPFDRGDLMERRGAIGFPAPHREAKIVASDLSTLPVGGRGELLIRGPGVFLGYYNEPAATAEGFADGWFRTGDLCSMSEDGCFYFHGRIKDSIKRSGENISAVEVESALERVPHIALAAVIGVPDNARGEEVKAYVVVDPGHEDDVPPDVIFAVCERELASFKIPRYLEYRTELPMTASGKVAKAVLASEKDDLRLGCYDRVEDLWCGDRAE